MKYPDVSGSLKLYRRAGELIPGSTQLISRRADQFANGVSPIYAQKAKGSRFTDVDGNEYVDWVNAVGAIILGHADDVVDNAVKAQIDRGSLYTELDINARLLLVEQNFWGIGLLKRHILEVNALNLKHRVKIGFGHE